MKLTKGYRLKDITPIVECSSRTIQSYVEIGLIIPEIHNQKGTGQKWRYSQKNVFEILLIKKLLGFGISRHELLSVGYIDNISRFWKIILSQKEHITVNRNGHKIIINLDEIKRKIRMLPQ